MSLWTIFRLCRYLMALARLKSMLLASRSVYLLEEMIASKRSPPWREGNQLKSGELINRDGFWYTDVGVNQIKGNKVLNKSSNKTFTAP